VEQQHLELLPDWIALKEDVEASEEIFLPWLPPVQLRWWRTFAPGWSAGWSQAHWADLLDAAGAMERISYW